MKPCKFCAEEIQDAAVYCRYCQRSQESSNARQSIGKARASLIIGSLVLLVVVIFFRGYFESKEPDSFSGEVSLTINFEDYKINPAFSTSYLVGNTSHGYWFYCNSSNRAAASKVLEENPFITAVALEYADNSLMFPEIFYIENLVGKKLASSYKSKIKVSGTDSCSITWTFEKVNEISGSIRVGNFTTEDKFTFSEKEYGDGIIDVKSEEVPTLYFLSRES